LQEHSLSFKGPKIFSQNNPPLIGFKFLLLIVSRRSFLIFIEKI